MKEYTIKLLVTDGSFFKKHPIRISNIMTKLDADIIADKIQRQIAKIINKELDKIIDQPVKVVLKSDQRTGMSTIHKNLRRKSSR